MTSNSYSRGLLFLRVRGLLASFILAAACLIIPFFSSSWAVETTPLSPSSVVSSAVESSFQTSSSSPTLADDPCRPLLRAISTSDADYARDDRQAASQAAAVGLIFGVRFALGPKEVIGSQRRTVGLNVWRPQASGSKALAVSDYRRCKNEHALENLKTLRWSR